MERRFSIIGLAAVIVLMASGLLIGAAAAQAPVVSVVLRAPAGCPPLETFDDLVRARLGYAAFDADAERTLHIEVTEVDGGFSGSMTDGVGDIEPQVIEGTSCDAVLEALATLAALAIDPLGEGRGAPARAGLPTDLSTLDDELPPRAHDEAPAGAGGGAAAGPRIFGELQLVANAGLASAVTLGGGLGIGLDWSGFALVAEAHLEATPADATVQGAEVRSWLWRAGLGPCLAHGILRGCASLQFGQAHVTSNRMSAPSSGQAWVGYGVARFGIEVPAGGLHWGASLQLFVPFLKPDLHFGDEVVWEAPPVAGGLSLSVRLGVGGS